jgi:hypothetical protein
MDGLFLQKSQAHLGRIRHGHGDVAVNIGALLLLLLLGTRTTLADNEN